jgi:hypothetical protein
VSSEKDGNDEGAGGGAEDKRELKPLLLNYARPRKRERMSFRDAILWIAVLIGAMVALTAALALLFPPKRHF